MSVKSAMKRDIAKYTTNKEVAKKAFEILEHQVESIAYMMGDDKYKLKHYKTLIEEENEAVKDAVDDAKAAIPSSETQLKPKEKKAKKGLTKKEMLYVCNILGIKVPSKLKKDEILKYCTEQNFKNKQFEEFKKINGLKFSSKKEEKAAKEAFELMFNISF